MSEDTRFALKRLPCHLGGVCLLLALVLVVSGCPKSGGTGDDTAKPVPRGKFTIMFSGSGLGELEDCGSTHNPRGGLARKATVINSLGVRSKGLVVNSGDTFFPVGPFGDVDGPNGAQVRQANRVLLANALAMADGEKLIGMDAMTPGETDFRFGLKTFNELTERAGIPVVSANLVSTQTDQLLYNEYIIKQIGDLKVGIIGVTGFVEGAGESAGAPMGEVGALGEEGERVPDAPVSRGAGRRRAMVGVNLPKGAGVKALPTVPALTVAAGRAKEEGAEILVLLAHMGWADARKVAEQVDGFSFAIVSHDRRFNSVECVNGVKLISGGFMGMQVGKLDVEIVKGDLKFRDLNEKAVLERTLSFDEQSLKAHQEALAGYGVEVSPDGGAEPIAGGQFVSTRRRLSSQDETRIEYYQKSMKNIQERIREKTGKINELAQMDLSQFDNYTVHLIELNWGVHQDPAVQAAIEAHKIKGEDTESEGEAGGGGG